MIEITSEDFTDRMSEINEDQTLSTREKKKAANELILDTMEGLGYEDGIQIFEEIGAWME